MIKFLFLVLTTNGVFGANILYLSAIPSPSHHIWNRALAFGLANKGHNVTLIGPEPDKVIPVNYSHIFMEGMYEALQSSSDINDLAALNVIQIIKEFIEMCVFVCEKGLRTEGVKTLLNYPPDFKFDLIVVDVTMGSCLYPFIHRFSYPPTVAVTPFLLPPYVGFNFGNHLHPAYVPWYGLPYTSNMTFVQRFWNFIVMYGETAFRNLIEYKEENKLAKEFFGQDYPSMEHLERHISLVLTNSDPILDNPQALAPNFISVGGLHTRKSKNIPKDLLTILDNAKSGVIVFSLGSMVRSDKLDLNKQKALLDAFSRVSQTVIWKFESDMDNVPKNVVLRKWLPQNDILGHPNVKLFIGHGGALSTQEAIFHGVPIICVPFFMDQHINTKNVVERKLGIFLDFQKITTEYVLEKLREILDNQVYAENMKRTSRIFKDRAETPLERAIFWTEYALRHGGAQFLNTPARDLPFYKSSSLDVVAFLTSLILIGLVLLYKIVKLVLGSSKNKKKFKRN